MVWLDITPFSWHLWPFRAQSIDATYPAESTGKYLRIGPLAICWGIK
jgi:hypothetical protein